MLFKRRLSLSPKQIRTLKKKDPLPYLTKNMCSIIFGSEFLSLVFCCRFFFVRIFFQPGILSFEHFVFWIFFHSDILSLTFCRKYFVRSYFYNILMRSNIFLQQIRHTMSSIKCTIHE